MCNIYGYNGTAQAKTMSSQLCSKIKTLKEKYKDEYLILGGDLNDAPNDSIEIVPVRLSQNLLFKT